MSFLGPITGTESVNVGRITSGDAANCSRLLALPLSDQLR
jgi:hypothetical protein